MKKLSIIAAISCLFLSCTGPVQDKQEVQQQEQYARLHTGYADSATLAYAINNSISPDSAVVVLRNGKR